MLPRVLALFATCASTSHAFVQPPVRARRTAAPELWPNTCIRLHAVRVSHGAATMRIMTRRTTALALPAAIVAAMPLLPAEAGRFRTAAQNSAVESTADKLARLRAEVAALEAKVPAAASAATKYCLNVKLSVKPSRRDEFIKVIDNNAKGTRSAEPLAVEYVWGESTTEPNIFFFYEKYKGREGFEAHTRTPHFAAWEAFVATEPFTAPPVVQFYEER